MLTRCMAFLWFGKLVFVTTGPYQARRFLSCFRKGLSSTIQALTRESNLFHDATAPFRGRSATKLWFSKYITNLWKILYRMSSNIRHLACELYTKLEYGTYQIYIFVAFFASCEKCILIHLFYKDFSLNYSLYMSCISSMFLNFKRNKQIDNLTLKLALYASCDRHQVMCFKTMEYEMKLCTSYNIFISFSIVFWVNCL